MSVVESSPITEVLDKVKGAVKSGAGWVSLCPAHDDKNPSLSIAEGDGGKVLIRCFAGCDYKDVLKALSMEPKQLFPQAIGKPKSKTEREYRLRNEKGELVAIHHRSDSGEKKRMWWSRPDGSNGLGGMRSEALPLYGVEALHMVPDDVPVVIVEGEKARDALGGLYPATLGTVTGASGTPSKTSLEPLKGRRVVLWPDNDEPGQSHMTRIAEALAVVAFEVRVFDWKEGGAGSDAADHPAIKSRKRDEVRELVSAWAASPVFEPGTEAKHAPVGTLVSEVQSERVSWLWPGRIPFGKLTVLDGDPGLGKSALTVDLAARVSVGRPWPDKTPINAAGVVLLNAEDGLADTIRPRLEAAGANLDRVLALATVPDGDSERLLSIPEDLPIIKRGIERVGAALVVVDPLMAFLSGDVNGHRDQDVRRALAPLAILAEETGAAVVVVRHLNKATGGAAIYRGGGSIGIVGAARSALLVAKDPEDEDRRVLAPLKANLGPPAPSLAFSLEEAANGAVRVEFRGETRHGAEALLAAPSDPEERSALDEAREFLADALKDGPVGAVEVKKDAQKADVKDATLRRAKTTLGVRSRKEPDGLWSWSLPSETGEKQGAQHDREDPPPYTLEHLEHFPLDKPIPGGSRCSS